MRICFIANSLLAIAFSLIIYFGLLPAGNFWIALLTAFTLFVATNHINAATWNSAIDAIDQAAASCDASVPKNNE